MKRHKTVTTLSCPAEVALNFLNSKWRPMVIYWLLGGALRFNELQRRLGKVTHRTLAKTLQDMEQDGLIRRDDHGVIPPRVDYALTDRGLSLKPLLLAMEQWAQEQGLPEPARAPQRSPSPTD